MRRLLNVGLVTLILIGIAHAASWAPTGGAVQDPAPNGNYRGNVVHIVIEDQEVIVIERKDPAGELRIGKGDCSTEEWNALTGAAPGTGEATVTIQGGSVSGVVVH